MYNFSRGLCNEYTLNIYYRHINQLHPNRTPSIHAFLFETLKIPADVAERFLLLPILLLP